MSRAIELLALHISECLPYLWRDADLTGNDAANALACIGADAVTDILPLHPDSPAVMRAADHVAGLNLDDMSGHDIVMAVLDAVRAGLHGDVPASPEWPAPVEMWCNEYHQDDAPPYMQQFSTRTQANICRVGGAERLSRWVRLPNRPPRFVWTVVGDTNLLLDPSEVYHTEDDCLRFMQSVTAKIYRWVEVPK